MTADPGAEFAAIISGALRDETTPDPAAEQPPAPRVPAPNRAQGTSGSSPVPISPAVLFAARLQQLAEPLGDGGWVDLDL